MYKVITFLLIIPINTYCFSQIFINKIFYSFIKTTQIRNNSNILSYPVCEINSKEKITVEFDDLNPNSSINDYQYTVFHCDNKWQKSDLFFSQYCFGNEFNYFDNISQSFNTLTFFRHYKVELPNNDLKFLLSGNYIFFVFKNSDPTDTVLTLKFSIFEKNCSITGQIKRPENINLYNTHQQIDFIASSHLFSFDNINQLKINIFQNNFEINYKYDIKPTFIENNKLIFSNSEDLVFKAGNEFRFIDIQNIRYQNEKIAKIDEKDQNIFVTNIEKTRRLYFFNKDINGKYLINNYLGTNSNQDADYLIVKFCFDFPYFDNKLFIFGDLSNGNLNQEFQLTYDFQIKKYFADILLKQGYYNYIICNSNKEYSDFEGDFYDTKNNYLIYIYLIDKNLNYDRLIGFETIGN